MKKKKGELLVENVIFLILNILFIGIIVLFLLKQGSGAVLLEQSYSKQIALLIDSSEPVMQIKLNMEKGKKLSDKNELDFSEVVKITDNVVSVKLSAEGNYEYSFFNDVVVNAYPEEEDDEYTGIYIFNVNKK